MATSNKSLSKTPPKGLVAIITSDAMRQQIAMVLPRHLTPERMVRVMLTQVRRNPKLLQCSQESVLEKLMTCSELGIEPDGRRAHLIPYGTECQLIIDYKGLAELARRSGEVRVIHADIVCENDEFVHGVNNSGPYIDHKPALSDRGAVIGAYSLVVLKDGTVEHEYMTTDEIEAVRKRSMAGQKGPWVTDWPEMAKKTVFRRHAKWLPLSAEFRDAVERDADQARDITSEVTSKTLGTSQAEALAARMTAPPDDDDDGDSPPMEPETPPEKTKRRGRSPKKSPEPPPVEDETPPDPEDGELSVFDSEDDGSEPNENVETESGTEKSNHAALVEAVLEAKVNLLPKIGYIRFAQYCRDMGVDNRAIETADDEALHNLLEHLPT